MVVPHFQMCSAGPSVVSVVLVCLIRSINASLQSGQRVLLSEVQTWEHLNCNDPEAKTLVMI